MEQVGLWQGSAAVDSLVLALVAAAAISKSPEVGQESLPVFAAAVGKGPRMIESSCLEEPRGKLAYEIPWVDFLRSHGL